jgi:hypothetical protein
MTNPTKFPQALTPIGSAQVQGASAPVTIDPEWMRSFENAQRELAELRARIVALEAHFP